MSIAKNHGIKPGTILESSWGYDQTNVNFYLVVKTSPSSVWITRLPSHQVDGDCWSGNCVPHLPSLPEYMKAKGMVRRVCNYGGDNWIKIASYQSARVWDGKPKMFTSGH